MGPYSGPQYIPTIYHRTEPTIIKGTHNKGPHGKTLRLNVPLLRALWPLLDGIWGVLKGSWGVLVEGLHLSLRFNVWAHILGPNPLLLLWWSFKYGPLACHGYVGTET